MMFSEANLSSMVFKQYRYKLRGFSFVGLVILQVVILLISLGGFGGSAASGSSNLLIAVRYVSADPVIGCSMVFVLFMSFMLTKKGYKNIDFSLVSSRLSSCLADWALLITLCFLAGFTSYLSGMLLRIIHYFTADHAFLLDSAFRLPLSGLLTGFLAVVLYMILVSSAGYLFGMLVELSLVFAILVPAAAIGAARTQIGLVTKAFGFFVNESSFILFALKICLLSVLFMSVSIILYSRKEVRR